MEKQGSRAMLRGQISMAGIAIGCVGCVIITASSVYTALKMGALPWPTIFTSVMALVLLRALGKTSLNEVNITQIIMSAGSMVAGGLAFTIPAIWMMGDAVPDGSATGWLPLLGVALAGTLLGLVATALIRRRFVDESDLEFPIGVAAAETLEAGRAGGGVGRKLFGAMGLAGAWCVLRDVVGTVPALFANLSVPGASVALYNSPMLVSVGFLLGGASAVLWLVGAVAGNVGIPVIGALTGAFDAATAQGIVASLGMGLMMGSGVGVVVRDILPKAAGVWRRGAAAGDADTAASATGPAAGAMDDAAHAAEADASASPAQPAGHAASGARRFSRVDAGGLALMVASAALLVCMVLGLAPVATLALVALAFVTAIMSAQSVGSTGIDPMEIFGLIALLAVAAISDATPVRLLYVAGVVAVACGLAGDVMSDFKTGALLGTSPRAMWAGQAIGALLGAVVAVATMLTLFAAYGPEAFGPGKLFVSAQASVVATMMAGIPCLPAFAAGLGAGVVLHCLRVPAMMLGLGVYLPFYMSATACVGAAVRAVYDRVCAARAAGSAHTAEANQAADRQRAAADAERGTLIASGIIGGESIVGVLVALVSVVTGLMG